MQGSGIPDTDGSPAEAVGAGGSRDSVWLQTMLEQHQIATADAGGLGASEMLSIVSSVLCSSASVEAIQVPTVAIVACAERCGSI